MREDIKKRIEAVRHSKVPDGYKTTKSGIAPLEWEEKKLGDFLRQRKTLMNVSEDAPLLSFTIEEGIIDPKNKKTNKRDFLIKDISSKKFALTEVGDIIYNPANLKFGAIHRNNLKRGVVSPIYGIFYGSQNSVFTGYLLHDQKFIDYAKIYTEGSVEKLKTLSADEFLKLKVVLPSMNEQQKIAEILTACDRVIELKQQLLEEKRRQKQWLMQKLLDPNSGVRLPGCEDSEWYTVTLDDYCDCLDTLRKPVNAQQREKMQGSYPYWGANSIQGYVNDYLFDEEIVLLAEDGGCFDDFKTKPIAVYVNEKCWVNNHAHILRAKNGNTKLLYFVLVHKDIRNYINGTTRSKLTQGDMMSISITLPKNPQEQKRLIDVLTACETEIELFEQELDVWQQKKKALMQLLLTGLVRVNV